MYRGIFQNNYEKKKKIFHNFKKEIILRIKKLNSCCLKKMSFFDMNE